MSKEQGFKDKFYKAVDLLEECSDVTIMNEHKVVTERGVAIYNKDFITYNSDNRLIKIYVDNKEVMSFGEDSPIISMFEGLILSMYEE